LQHSGMIRGDGHFSAYGMPNGNPVISPRAELGTASHVGKLKHERCR
jgi:hypothetical protein